ncbi:MAG: PucR family transcriptional regulator [Nocardioidaceae bacterium]|nr:PucR family transcriptional regulator [Nocardioidaceae bacterium]
MSEEQSADLDTTAPDPREHVSLAWLLERRELDLLAHHLPDPGAPLEWAHAIEVDDPSPWLHGPGLVLTTGMRLPRNRLGQEAYVERLALAGATALGLGTGLRLAAVPFGVAAACREHDLALLEVPFATPFLAVERAVTDRLAELRRQRLLDTLADQQRLTRAVLRTGLAGLARALATSVDATVVIVGVDGSLITSSGGPLRVEEVLAEEVLAEVAGRRPGTVRVTDPGRVLEIQPIGGSPREPVGWLALASAGALSAPERLLVSHAVSVATVELARPADGPDPALGAAVLEALLGGRPIAPEAALAARGLDPAGPLVLTAVRAGRPETLDRLLPSLRRLGPLLDRGPDDAPSTRLLLTGPAGARSVLAALPADLAAVTGPPAAWPDLGRLVAPLLRSLESAPPGARITLPESPVDRVLADPVLASAAAPWVAALAAYDGAHGSDLVASLRTFLTHHGAWDPAAQRLGVHRHTLRHRVERAADVAGFDLDDASHRALLLLTLGAADARPVETTGGPGPP